jgi:hypothetical protein
MIIKIDATEQNRKSAITAHELFTINTMLIHIIGTLGLIKLLNTSIIGSILTLLGTMPLFFAVLVSAELGTGSMFNAGRGEVEQKYPQ